MSQQALYLEPPGARAARLLIAGTGHRPHQRNHHAGVGTWGHRRLHVAVANWLEGQLLTRAPAEVISGMAAGVDTWLAEAALRLGLPLVAAIPFLGQEDAWPEVSQRHYRGLLERAARVVNVSGHDERAARASGCPLPAYAAAHLMHERNTWMVRQASLVLAVWDGSSKGGTAHAVAEAHRLGRQIVRNPLELRDCW